MKGREESLASGSQESTQHETKKYELAATREDASTHYLSDLRKEYQWMSKRLNNIIFLGAVWPPYIGDVFYHDGPHLR